MASTLDRTAPPSVKLPPSAQLLPMMRFASPGERAKLDSAARAAVAQLEADDLPADPANPLYSAKWRREHQDTAAGIAILILVEIRHWSDRVLAGDEYDAHAACLTIGGLVIKGERAFTVEQGRERR